MNGQENEIMDLNEIIEMAKQAGLLPCQGIHMGDLKAFAKLVAAKERKEICATVQQIVPITSWAHELLDAIRARA
jgi:hypothetical protein